MSALGKATPIEQGWLVEKDLADKWFEGHPTRALVQIAGKWYSVTLARSQQPDFGFTRTHDSLLSAIAAQYAGGPTICELAKFLQDADITLADLLSFEPELVLEYIRHRCIKEQRYCEEDDRYAAFVQLQREVESQVRESPHHLNAYVALSSAIASMGMRSRVKAETVPAQS